MHIPLFSFLWGRSFQSLLAFVFCTMCGLEMQQAPTTCPLLSAAQGNRICQIPSVLWNRWDRNQFLWQSPHPPKRRTLNSCSNSLAFQEEERSWGHFVLLIPHSARRRGSGEWEHVSLNCCLCFQWPLTWCPSLWTLRFRQDVQAVRMLNVCFRLVIPFSGETRRWKFSLYSSTMRQERLQWVSAMDFLSQFHAAGFSFIWGVGPFHWFLNSSQRELVCILLWNLYLYW